VPLWSAVVAAQRVFLVEPLVTMDVNPLVPEIWTS
jgi:hypothetical protein